MLGDSSESLKILQSIAIRAKTMRSGPESRRHRVKAAARLCSGPIIEVFLKCRRGGSTMLSRYAEGDLLVSLDDGVVTAVFNRPASRNALTFEMYAKLATLCTEAAQDEAVHAIILTGAGDKAFAAGTDIAQFLDFKSPADGLAYEKRMEEALEPVERCPKPIIAAIAGACTGGGAAIAACCDLRIATADMRFGVPIARSLGNTLSIANYRRLLALLGPSRLKNLIFTARLIDAQEAQAIGLLTDVVAHAAELMPRARALAKQLLSHAPLSLKACKESLRRLQAESERATDEDLVSEVYGSADFREGMAAFLAKRTPQWTGR